MFKILQTETFAKWLRRLKDEEAKARIFVRMRQLGQGHFGDSKSVGEGVHEMRIDHGPGYRVYYKRKGAQIIVLLVGGDKSTQRRDIDKAIALGKETE
ncbi:MAG: type II toxin-antitoxin system RelE/ParE family toxin [Burkholderiaceae bacterium]|nr:type II toxin-antitoxin system RelE/ParE family toxin [Burkholderiaceae bacterium]